jgi:hypothetical protein
VFLAAREETLAVAGACTRIVAGESILIVRARTGSRRRIRQPA